MVVAAHVWRSACWSRSSIWPLLFEQISAYSTAGLSTGITAELCPASRVVLILTMFIGRVGAVTLLSLWVERPEPTPAIPKKPLRLGKCEAARQPP